MSSDAITNVMQMLIQEHKIITDYVATFSEKLKAKDKDKDFFEGLKTFVTFLGKDLLKHFETEELVVFPAAILGAPAYDTTLTVMKLQKDHGSLEKQLESVIEASKNVNPMPGTLNDTMIDLIKAFFDQLRTHVKRELIELYPMVNENLRSRALLKSYAEEFKNKPSGEPEPF